MMSERRHTVNLILATVERLFEGHVLPSQKFREAVYDDLSCIDELDADLDKAKAANCILHGRIAELDRKLSEAEADRDKIKTRYVDAYADACCQLATAQQQLAEAEAERDRLRGCYDQLASAYADACQLRALAERERDEARQQLSEIEAADQQALVMWREWNPDFDLIEPGKTNLTIFTLDRLRDAQAELKQAWEAHDETMAERDRLKQLACDRLHQRWDEGDEARQQLAELRELGMEALKVVPEPKENDAWMALWKLFGKLATPAQPEPEPFDRCGGPASRADNETADSQGVVTEQEGGKPSTNTPEPEITEQDKTWEQFCDEVKAELGLDKVFGPDPGEGYEWAKVGMAGGDDPEYPGHYRRRKVMTEPPSGSVNGKVWLLTVGGRALPTIGGAIEAYDDVSIAWCHRLDGETEAPKILVDYREGE